MKISIIGCGWLGLPLAKHFLQKGYFINGTTTDEKKIPTLKKSGIEAHFLKITDKNIEGDIDKIISGSNYIVLNFPPKRIENIESIYPKIVRNLLPFICKNQKIIFVSSTAVYQNTNGWVNETLPCKPSKKSGIAVLTAEKILQDFLRNRLCILRLSGLIGGDRMPANFLSGKKNISGGSAPVNLIHRDDCIGLIESIIENDAFGEIFNGCSDKHPLRKDFYRKAAANVSLPMPTFTAEKNQNFKMICNQKSKTFLGYDYKHPDPFKLI